MRYYLKKKYVMQIEIAWLLYILGFVMSESWYKQVPPWYYAVLCCIAAIGMSMVYERVKTKFTKSIKERFYKRGLTKSLRKVMEDKVENAIFIEEQLLSQIQYANYIGLAGDVGEALEYLLSIEIDEKIDEALRQLYDAVLLICYINLEQYTLAEKHMETVGEGMTCYMEKYHDKPFIVHFQAVMACYKFMKGEQVLACEMMKRAKEDAKRYRMDEVTIMDYHIHYAELLYKSGAYQQVIEEMREMEEGVKRLKGRYVRKAFLKRLEVLNKDLKIF